MKKADNKRDFRGTSLAVSRISGIIWLLTIVIFSLFTLYLQKNTSTSTLDKLIISDIVFGIIAFVVSFFSFLVAKSTPSKQISDKTKKMNHRITYSLLTIILLLLTFGIVRANRGDYKNTNSTAIAKITPTPTATPTNKAISIKKSNSPKPSVDTDPIVDCQINANCGGGTSKMRSSACSKTTCCQVWGTWSSYPSLDTCKAEQEKEYALIRVKIEAVENYKFELPPLNTSAFDTSDAIQKMQDIVNQPSNIPDYKYSPIPIITPTPSPSPKVPVGFRNF